MTINNRMLQHRGNQPWFYGVVCLVSCLIASCQSNDDGPTRLSLLEWNGYQHARYYPEYMEKYGEPPLFTFFDQAENAMRRMRTGYRVDLVHLCTPQLAEARDAGLIKPIDTDRISRWSEVTPELLDLPSVRMDGQYWLLPWEWGYSTVAYNPELLDVEDPTYEIFIDPRFKGETALPSDIAVNMIIAGVIGDWADPLDPTDEELEGVTAIFSGMLENARFIWTDGTQLEQAWAAGDVGLSYVFGSATRRMAREGLTNVIIEPLQTWLCGLSLSASSTTPDEVVYDYLDAMLDPESGAAMFDDYGYGHGNSNTLKLLDPALAKEWGIDDPAGLFARGVFTRGHPPAKKSKMFQLWYEAQAGLE